MRHKLLYAALGITVLALLAVTLFYLKQDKTIPSIDEKLSEQHFLEPTAQQVILEKAAEYPVSELEIDQFITALQKQGLTQEQLTHQLAVNNLSQEDFREQIRVQMHIAKLIHENVDLHSVTVSEEEVDNYLHDYPDVVAEFASEGAEDLLRARVYHSLLQQKQARLIEEYAGSVQ